jgi:hypothetical protein
MNVVISYTLNIYSSLVSICDYYLGCLLWYKGTSASVLYQKGTRGSIHRKDGYEGSIFIFIMCSINTVRVVRDYHIY